MVRRWFGSVGAIINGVGVIVRGAKLGMGSKKATGKECVDNIQRIATANSAGQSSS